MKPNHSKNLRFMDEFLLSPAQHGLAPSYAIGADAIRFRDIQHGRLWDVVKFRAGDTWASPEFFSHPINKTRAETNVTMHRKLDPPSTFAIKRIIFTFNHGAKDIDIHTITESFQWDFYIGEKYYLSALLMHMETRYTFVGRQFIMNVAPNLVIDYLVPFFIVFNQEGREKPLPKYQLQGDLKLWCHFEGLHARGVA